MGSAAGFDAAVIGGGVMGCTTALHLARGGMRVVLFERGGLCREASGRNAGTLTMLYTRASLIPYALRGRELWRDAAEWLGGDAGFHDRHGLELAFTEEVAETLAAQMKLRAEAGAPIEMVGGNRARGIEPALSDKVVAAAHGQADGYAHSYVIGDLFHSALRKAGVAVRDATPVLGVESAGRGHLVRTARGDAKAHRIVLAGGAWIGTMAAWFGADFPIACRVNQGSISERMRPILAAIIRVPNDLSLKQLENGTVLMGGGRGEHWIEDPDRGDVQQDPDVVRSKMVTAVQDAQRAVPALAGGRVVRTWTGFEAFAPDNQPIIGPMPGARDVHVVAGLRSGFTIGPFVGKLLAHVLLGREPELPIFASEFDPARIVGMAPFDTTRVARLA